MIDYAEGSYFEIEGSQHCCFWLVMDSLCEFETVQSRYNLVTAGLVQRRQIRIDELSKIWHT
jgi:hypothetical protein